MEELATLPEEDLEDWRKYRRRVGRRLLSGVCIL